MKPKIGLIQTRGIGDIIIALPIADHYLENGYDVYWPVDHRWVTMFQRVKPEVNFLAVEGKQEDGASFFLAEPLRLLQEHACEKTIILYSFLGGLNVVDTRLSGSLKFDEYKYAIARVPFARKWALTLHRDLEREEALYDRLQIERPYVVVHDTSSDMSMEPPIPPGIESDYQIIRISEITDSPFDWISTLERASKLIMLDSCFSNLVEQLNIKTQKRLILRSDVRFTPVYKNGWEFGFAGLDLMSDTD